jgi:hypothetical protein
MRVPKVPYAAYLRVYEPLAAFPEPERSHWAEYAKREELPDAQEELRRALTALLSGPVRAAPERESQDAFVTTLNGVLCVCPWRTRLRAWEALAEVGHWMMPDVVLDLALPRSARQRAEEQYERWLRGNPDARPWIRSALWHVPIRWFALFTEEEREHRGPPPEAGARATGTLRYRTPMAQARRRLARALRTVRTAAPEGPLAPALVEVGRWLEEFHPRSLVELDYGGLVHTISAERLAGDHSAAEVHQALAALGDEDLERASELYEALTERWMDVRERQFAS